MKVEVGKTYRTSRSDWTVKITKEETALYSSSRWFLGRIYYANGVILVNDSWRWLDDGRCFVACNFVDDWKLVELCPDIVCVHVAYVTALKTSHCRLCEEPIYYDTSGEKWAWVLDSRRGT